MTTKARIVKRTNRATTKQIYEISPARRSAFDILRRVEERREFASELLATEVDDLRIEDRALCHELVLGVLRRQMWLDGLIGRYAERNARKINARVLIALRIGLYQMRFLSRVPLHAAVNEAVNLARAFRFQHAANFINAVLRRAAREPNFDPTSDAKSEIEKLSVETSHPLWLLERWIEEFGFDETAKLARANNETPPVSFRFARKVPNPKYQVPSQGEVDSSRFKVQDSKSEDQRSETEEQNTNWQSAIENRKFSNLGLGTWDLGLSKIAPDAWRLKGESAEERAQVRELARAGVIYLQDEASQLVAHLVGAQAGERILDACAAPGSKTTQMAASTQDEALIVAGDRSAARLRILIEAIKRQSLKSVRVAQFDAERLLPFADETFDRILVDAPCSGTGTLRRNPEIRYRLTREDLARMAARQKQILANAARALRRGGRLVYSTCSLEREENEAVIADFLREHADFRLIKPNLPAQLLTADARFARTFPQRDDTDGFFIAALEKQG